MSLKPELYDRGERGVFEEQGLAEMALPRAIRSAGMRGTGYAALSPWKIGREVTLE